MMIRPASFRGNEETRATNAFQAPASAPPDPAPLARRELDRLAEALERAGVEVHCFAGRPEAALPDEVFPNNWLSLHCDATAVLYPMMAPNRRRERRRDVLDALIARGYRIDRVIDLSPLEDRGLFLEGTGSLVLDRVQRVAYACRSPRTSPAAVGEFGRALGFDTLVFDARGRDGRAVYHTNVLMTLGTRFALVAAAAIADPDARRRVLERIEASGRELIELSSAQMHAFAGNALELDGARGPIVALSERAYAALDRPRRRRLERYGEPVTAALDTLETHGGGSVRCTLVEIHLPRRPD